MADGSNGRPVTTGSVTNSEGNVLASVHIGRLQRLADKLEGRDQQHVLAAIQAITLLARKNRRLGGMVGGVMKRGLLNYRGIALTGKLEDIAETIADLCDKQQVTVYRWRDMRKIRVVAGGQVPSNGRLIGTYGHTARYDDILGDLQVPDRGPAFRARSTDSPELVAMASEFGVTRKVAREMVKADIHG